MHDSQDSAFRWVYSVLWFHSNESVVKSSVLFRGKHWFVDPNTFKYTKFSNHDFFPGFLIYYFCANWLNQHTSTK